MKVDIRLRYRTQWYLTVDGIYVASSRDIGYVLKHLITHIKESKNHDRALR